MVSGRSIEGPPTLALQIRSPSTIQIDRNAKFQFHARFAVPHYWIVGADARTIEAYRLAQAVYDLVAPMEGRHRSRSHPSLRSSATLGHPGVSGEIVGPAGYSGPWADCTETTDRPPAPVSSRSR